MNNHLNQIATCLVGVFFLIGCGGGGESSDNKNTPSLTDTLPIKAYSAFSVVEPNKKTTIDMSQHTENAKKLDIISSNDLCSEPDINGITLTVDYQQGQFCDYQYQVTSPTGKQASSTLTLLATSADDAFLMPHSAAIIASSGQSHSFNLPDILASEWLPSFSLNPSVQVSGNDAIGSATVVGNSINYIAVGEPTWNTITYTVVDNDNPNNHYIGYIHITLSNDANNAPSIAMPHYNYNLQTGNNIEARENINIDLSALPNLNIQSESDWYLVAVQSFTSDVNLIGADPNNSKGFSFTSPTIGRHIVSYIVSDGDLGYTPATIIIDVISKEKQKTWSELKLTSVGNIYTYSSPRLYSEVSSTLSVKPYWDPVVENTLATFTASQAEYYCSEFGDIPKVSELYLLWQKGSLSSLDLGDLSAMPKQLNYFARDDKDLSIKKFDLDTGISAELIGDESLYLTCLKSDRLAIETLTRRFTADGNSYNAIVVDKSENVLLDIEAVISANETITDNDITIDVDPLFSDKDLIKISSIKSGDFRLSISNGDDVLTTPNLSFIGDIETVKIANMTITRNANISGQEDFHDGRFLIANDSDSVRFDINLTDANENAIENAMVEIVHNETDVYSANLGVDFFSDNQGNITLDYLARESLFVTGDYDDKTWDFDIKINDLIERGSLPIKHKNFTGRIILEDIRYEELYIAATIKVMIGGQLVQSTVTTENTLRGTFMHVDGVQDYVSSFSVPTTGKSVFISTGDNSVEPKMEFTLSGSPFPAMLLLPEGVRIVRNEKHISTVDHIVTEDDLATETLLNEFQTYNRINYFRGSSSAPRYIYLPDLSQVEGDHIGKIMMVQNGAGNTTRFFSNDRAHYWTLKEKVNTTCITRGFYWNGSSWVAMNPAVSPELKEYTPNCTNRY